VRPSPGHEQYLVIGFVALLADVIHSSMALWRQVAFIIKVVDVCKEALAFGGALSNSYMHQDLPAGQDREKLPRFDGQ